MKIFNRQRNLAIESQRIKRYFLYAIGEIILVVIGIVIGLQVNNWNQQNNLQQKIETYYDRIHAEADFSIQLIEHNTQFSDTLIVGLTNCLQQMADREIDSSFQRNLSFLTDNEQQTLFFPVIDEFLELGYLSAVEDLELREYFTFLAYIRKQSVVDDVNIQTFSEHLLKPTLVNKLNYLEIDYIHKSGLYPDPLQFDNAPKNDYNQLANDQELWNLIVYRIDYEKIRIVNNQQLIDILQKIKKKMSKVN